MEEVVRTCHACTPAIYCLCAGAKSHRLHWKVQLGSFFEEADLAWPRSPEPCRMLSPPSGHTCCSLLRNMQLMGCKYRDTEAHRGCCPLATPHHTSHVQKQLCLVKLLRYIRSVIKQPNPVINFNDM